MIKIKKFEDDSYIPEIGSLVSFYDEYTGDNQKGIIVDISIEDYEDEIVDDEGNSEEILVEYLVFVIVNKSGIHYSEAENIFLIAPPTIKNF